ncbi:restriction endonuclease subunit S [Corallococcus sp. AB049A]|uniref:restriction endonuclease subunit S n=1 Tax=Corallococcus sp. AB049A TaxID=2316721 RepID=UPI000EBA6508|nr:restriction endonuclease subunit S [Corallococcus sp. AB049A]RKI74232.1 restriction endonuclease subunit S [Corallococcus sp. AB049A]
MKGWLRTRLGDCCEIVSGATPSTSVPSYWDGDIYWATPKDLSGLRGAYIGATERRITRAGLQNCAAEVLMPGAVLFSSRAPIGHVAMNTVPMATNQGFKSLVPKPDQVHPTFLYHWLRKHRSYLESLGNGATFKEVSKSVVARVEIVLPPLVEQRRIAVILDRAEALRGKRREALEGLDVLPQAMFASSFGAPDVVLKQWTNVKLGEVLDFLTSGSRGWAAHYAESGDLFLRIQNVRNDELLLDDVAFVTAPKTAEAVRTRVQVGDVLLSITADLGRTAVIPDGLGPAYINQHLSILRTKALHPRFLSAFLVSPTGRQQVLGRNRQGVKAGLNFDDIRSFVIPNPPAGLQEAFAQRVAVIDKLKVAHRASLAEMDALVASLSYRAFRGEL